MAGKNVMIPGAMIRLKSRGGIGSRACEIELHWGLGTDICQSDMAVVEKAIRKVCIPLVIGDLKTRPKKADGQVTSLDLNFANSTTQIRWDAHAAPEEWKPLLDLADVLLALEQKYEAQGWTLDLKRE